MQRAPGIPCALYFAGRTVFAKTRTPRAAGSRRDVIARSEATKQSTLLFVVPNYGLLRFARNDGTKNTPRSQPSSPGLTGRTSIPETSAMESRSRSVLDTPHARGMTMKKRHLQLGFCRHCEDRSDEAIHSVCLAAQLLDCFADPAIGCAFARPVGSHSNDAGELGSTSRYCPCFSMSSSFRPQSCHNCRAASSTTRPPRLACQNRSMPSPE